MSLAPRSASWDGEMAGPAAGIAVLWLLFYLVVLAL
jgi:hypothetical protein